MLLGISEAQPKSAVLSRFSPFWMPAAKCRLKHCHHSAAQILAEARIELDHLGHPREWTAPIKFDNAGEALQHINASGRGVAISIGGKVLVVEQSEADCIAERRIEFAYLVDHPMPDGSWRIMTIPVND